MTKPFPTTLALATALAAGTGTAFAQDQTVVDWWGWAPAIETAEEYMSAFEEDNPDIDVRFRSIPYADYTQALRLGLVSSAGPDVYNLEPGVITSQFSRFAVDLTGAVEEALGDDWREKLSPIGVQDFTVADELLALPVQIGAAGQIWYNQGLFEEAGVEPPTTLEEWKEVCAKFTAMDVTCFVQGAKDAWVNLDTYIAIAESVAPGKISQAIAGEVDWTDEDLVEALRIWKGLFTDGIMQPGALGIAQYPDARNLWVAGDAAMIMMGTWHANVMGKRKLEEVQQAAGQQPSEFVSMSMGFPDVAGKGNAPGLYGGADYGVAVSKRADQKEAATAFAAFLATSEKGASLVAENTFPPALQSVAFKVPDFVDEAAQQPLVDQITEDLGAIETSRQIPYAKLKEALSNALSAVAADTMSPEEAADTVQSASASTKRD